MELTQDTYTKEEVQALFTEQEGKVTDLTAKLDGFETLKKDNLSNSIKLEMLKNGLSEDLFDLVSADDVEVSKTKISKLVELNKKNKVDNSYKPEDHKNTDDEYSIAEKKGDTQSMLKSKLSKLFN